MRRAVSVLLIILLSVAFIACKQEVVQPTQIELEEATDPGGPGNGGDEDSGVKGR